MEFILTLIGYAALIAVSLGGFAAAVAYAVALFAGKHTQGRPSE
jgi:hypothetical protein